MIHPTVSVRRESISLPTYEPLPADKNPMFLEKRVYQGSSGKVYPLPFFDRIADQPTARKWDAITLENDFLRVMILPEIGGRIHIGHDKTNGYDFFYRQDVIKPALVGLAGPWISGGVEFNWPQHHRPATFMPVDVDIEKHDDGSVTVWCSDHDPMSRMKGMHGVCIHPDRALIELKVRAYNRTPFVQTFLWWANVATRVHEAYQSFFPPDVSYVADHARRSMSTYPLCSGHYYGVDYAARGKSGIPSGEIPAQFVPSHCGGTSPVAYKPNDLSFYANIPVPTSYMCMGSQEDFFGGYDHKVQAGVVHVANHHISPGKKQWTWGNHDFGYSWDKNLTDADAGGEFPPYIEIMAGVYTDNQPDFSFLMPGETKTWSQFWYPIQKIGPADHANVAAAVSLKIDGKKILAGLSAARKFPKARLTLTAHGKRLKSLSIDLLPGAPTTFTVALPPKTSLHDLCLVAWDSNGDDIIRYSPKPRVRSEVPPPATEPQLPSDIPSTDELFITGLHLEQYRHATRGPEAYWREALQRDPLDSRCNHALGRWHLHRGEFSEAEKFFRKAIERLTRRNANPYDGEPYYSLGITLRYLGRNQEAYDAFYKAAWNQPWQAASYHAIAELDSTKGDWTLALDHIDRSLRLNTDNLRARNLRALVLGKLGLDEAAQATLNATRRLDPLDWWARDIAGENLSCDDQTRLDIAIDYSRAGFYQQAADILTGLPSNAGTAPLVGYFLAFLHSQLGKTKSSLSLLKKTARTSPDYCFPSRLEDILVLQFAMDSNPGDSLAPYLLGNLLYDRKRHSEAIKYWELSTKISPNFPTVWRNLGIAYFNISHSPTAAKSAYEKAFRLAPQDARIAYERDQLWKRLGESPKKRLAELTAHRDLCEQRDDLSVELCALYNQVGQPESALEILRTRKFQPWEGGEGQALGQHVRTHMALGKGAYLRKDYPAAITFFEQALRSPDNLSEAKHLLANQSDIHLWLGRALKQSGKPRLANLHWKLAADFRGDFQNMSVQPFSEMTYFSAIALQLLGRKNEAERILIDLLNYAKSLEKSVAKIDYFATSLPTMLLFDEDLQFRQVTHARLMQAQAQLGLGQSLRANKLFRSVLERDPNHALAFDFLTNGIS